jgi:hypothetical protein
VGLETEEYVQAADAPGALEYLGAGGGIQIEPSHGLAGTVGAGDLDSRRSRPMGDHRRLARGKRHRAGLEIEAALLAVEIVEVERSRREETPRG